MKCIAVSDIHLKDIKTPEADLLIVAGDMTMTGEANQIEWFCQWLYSQPQKNKVWIAGNHDFDFEREAKLGEKIAEKTDSVYLNDSEVVIDGVKIWGSPITPEFHHWAFNRSRGFEIRKHWNAIPENVDILITHGPPLGYLDAVEDEHVGCEDLLNKIQYELKHPPRYHVFGHIHEGYGRSSIKREDGKVVELINASSCDRKYNPVNPPIEFEV